MSIDKRFDDVLMTMAGQAGSLEVLLRIFFSFLHRNTDFYVTYDASKVKATMGFPPGKAEKLLLSSFRSFPHKSYTNPGSSSSSAGKNSMKVESIYKDKPKKAQEASSKPLPDSTHKSTATSSPDRASSTSANSPTSKCITSTGAPSDSAGENKRSATNTTPSATSAVASTASPAESETCVERMRIRYTDDGKQIPIGNGGVTPRYYWTQNVTETTVYVDVPEGTRSKDVDCKIGPRRLRLAVRGAGAHAGLSSDGDVIIDGEMPSVVSKEDSMWSLSDGMSVVISLEKTKRSWWQSVVEGDPEIDTTQVDSTSKIGDYDEETQGAIRKIMFDQRQKALGLPTSDELTADSLLEKAKGLPGSPFLPGGTLFDGSMGDANVAPDGGLRDTL